MRRSYCLALLLGLVATGAALAAAPADTLFEQERDVPLGASLDRFDYQSFDPATGRLFVAMMSEGRVLVFDSKANRVLAQLDGFPKVTGVLAVPALGKLYASVPGAGVGPSLSVALGMAGLGRGSGRVAILDLATLQERARVPAGVFPDGLAFDPINRRIFVSDELGHALTVIDGTTDLAIGRIDLGGQVGNVRYDPSTRRIYAPVQSNNELVTVDPAASRIVARTKLSGGDHPHGLLIAPRAPVGFVACDGNDRLVVVALDEGRVLADLPVGHDPDVLAIDPQLDLLYVAAESGEMAVFDIRTPTQPRPLGIVHVGDGAHTVEVDPTTHRVFLPLRNVHGEAVLRILRPKREKS